MIIDPAKVKLYMQKNKAPQQGPPPPPKLPLKPPAPPTGGGAKWHPPMAPPKPKGTQGINYQSVLAYLPKKVQETNVEPDKWAIGQHPMKKTPYLYGTSPAFTGKPFMGGKPTGEAIKIEDKVLPQGSGPNEYKLSAPKPMPAPGWKTDLGMIVGRIQGHFAEGQEMAQDAVKSVAEGGKGKYVPIKGASDILYNTGQWQPFPGIEAPGKALTALGEGTKLLGSSAMLLGEVANVGAEMIEREVGKAYFYNMTPLGAEAESDPLKKLALDQAIGITYSGPEAVRSAYNEAYELAKTGQLTPDNVEVMNARHGVWYKEALGQIILDPLNLVDGVMKAGKGLRYATQFQGAEKMFKTPWLSASKGWVPVEDVYKGFAELSTRAGQIKEAETILDKAAAFINPRLASSNIHRQGERIAQVVDIAAGITNKSAMVDVAQMGLKPGTAEFTAEVSKMTATKFQDVASLWAETANQDANLAEAAANALKRLGYGDIPKSVMGRRTGVVLRSMMEKPNGEMGAITDILKIGKLDELAPEMVVHQIYEHTTKVLSKLIPETFEKGAVQKAARWVLKKEKPIKDAMGVMYFGLNPGYALRNFYDNAGTALMNGYNPFKPMAHLEEKLGFHVAGAERGIGQAGATMGPISNLAQRGEKFTAKRVAEQAQMDALKLYWPDALKELGEDFPVGLKPVIRDLIWKDAGEIDRLAGLGDVTVDAWRHAPDEIMEALSGADQALPARVVDALGAAKSPEEAITAVRKVMREFAEHAEKMAEKAKPIGGSIGTATGNALQMAATSGKVSEATLTTLSKTLGELEHGLGVARNRAYKAIQAATDPARWQAMLTKVEGRYNKEMEDIIRRQMIGYARLEAGEITEAQYSKQLERVYKEAQANLLKKYDQIIKEEEVISPHLRKMLLQEAAAAQYPSAVVKASGETVTDAHFMNKVRQILRDTGGLTPEQAKQISHLSKLTDDQLLTVTNAFRELNSRPALTLEQLYGDLFPKLEDELAELRRLEPLPPTEAADAIRLANSADPQAKMAALAAKGEIPVGPSPSLADAAFNAPAHRALDDLAKYIVQNANVKQQVVAAELPPFWAKVKSLYTETHTMAAELGRRNRDATLLDYNDWRYLDPLLSTVFPWHYWASRKPANWLMSIASRPTPALHYMKMKKELRQYNDNDPSVPAWAKDKIVLHPPGYPGALYLDYERSFNAVASMYDSFDDPDRRLDAYGETINAMGKFGPAIHPLLTMAYGAERWVMGDDEGARSVGYLSSPTRAIANLTGFTLEPWLWGKDPRTGNRTPWVGGTKWDMEKATRKLGYEQGQGRFSGEEAVLGAVTQGGPAFTEVLTKDIVQYRRWPIFFSMALGLTVSPRQDWENEVQEETGRYFELKNSGQEAEAQALIDNKPWLGTVWFSWESDATRMKMLANNVLARIGPMPGKNRQVLLESVGLSSELVQQFYDIPNDQRDQMVEWDRRDYEQFTNGVMDLAEILKMPDPRTIQEWRDARAAYKDNTQVLDQKYPNALKSQAEYFDIKEREGDEAAGEYLAANPELSGYWNEKNHLMLQNPLVLKYYQEPAQVDQIAESMAWEEVKGKYPDIFELWDEYGQIDDKDWKAKREFRRLHPEITKAGDEFSVALRNTREALGGLRTYAGSGAGGPDTTDYIIQGKPNAAQRGTLAAIEAMEIEATKPVPLPKEKPDPFTPEQEALMSSRDKVYADAVAQFPGLPTWEREYDQIKYLYGDEAATLYGQQSGLFKARDVMTMAEISNPILLADMDDKSLGYAAKAYMRYDAEGQWPGIFKMLDEYYALPKKGNEGNNRHEYGILHPEVYKYFDWKGGAPEYYEQQLRQMRSQAREGQMSSVQQPTMSSEQPVSSVQQPTDDLSRVREAIGKAESGGNYAAQNANSSASGKYQYITSTWNDYGGYASAKEAPQEIQDQRIMEDLQKRFDAYGGDLDKVIAAHYYPAWANDKSKWGQAPVAGSPTIQKYVDYVKRYM